MTTLADIEKAIEELPVEQRRELLGALTASLDTDPTAAPEAGKERGDPFAEMDAFTVSVGRVDDSREAIYQRRDGE